MFTYSTWPGSTLALMIACAAVSATLWAVDAQPEESRYQGWPGAMNFVKDKLLGSGWECREARSDKPEGESDGC
jgi:hypothetical protein